MIVKKFFLLNNYEERKQKRRCEREREREKGRKFEKCQGIPLLSRKWSLNLLAGQTQKKCHCYLGHWPNIIEY